MYRYAHWVGIKLMGLPNFVSPITNFWQLEGDDAQPTSAGTIDSTTVYHATAARQIQPGV